jgi:3-demethoxyubiquinol 3-hydroxylase
MTAMNLPSLDHLLTAADKALRTISGGNTAARPCPQPTHSGSALSDEQRALSGALMRVNHVGEICAQAMYNAQALSTRDPALRLQFEQAAREETDHLVWTQQRLRELNARPSLLNPLWYVGAFGIGLLAGRAGDGFSLGFVVETERQVEQHLADHMTRLPVADTASHAIVAQMQADEVKHGETAQSAGARDLPRPVRWAMRATAWVMTTTSYRI